MPKKDYTVELSKGVVFWYGMNIYLYANATNLNVSRITYPSSTVLMSETGEGNFSVSNPLHVRAYFGTGVGLLDRNSVANFLFCDGHVEAAPRTRFDAAYGGKPLADPPIPGGLNFKPYENAVSN
jgi:prepilin-type processing-associated H-X9-DG protein